MNNFSTFAVRPTCTWALLLCFAVAVGGQSSPSRIVPPKNLPHTIENAPALANFFRALRASQSAQRLEPVRIMHFGDSHIAADILTAQIRRRFQEEFGDGGPGYIVPRNPMSTRRRGVTSGASNGWTIEGIGGHVAGDGIYAPAGIALATNLAYEKAWLQTSANHFEVYYVSQPGGGSIDVTVDGASVLDAPLSLVSRLPRLNYFSYDEPVADNYRVEVRTVAPGKVRVLGIVAERVNPGVSYDVLGINGARATRLLDWNAAAFAGVLTQRKPDLIILAFGTNEAGDPDWTAAAHQQVFTRILRRLHNAVPRASILIYGPPERADNPLAARRMRLVIESQRQAALAGNAAFWSSYDAMGGPGSMNAWITRGLGQADHVHLSGPGYVRMGDLFYEALMRAYRGGQ